MSKTPDRSKDQGSDPFSDIFTQLLGLTLIGIMVGTVTIFRWVTKPIRLLSKKICSTLE